MNENVCNVLFFNIYIFYTANHIESLLKSVLFIISSVIEDRSKESTDAVISLLNLVSEITESRKCPPLTCLVSPPCYRRICHKSFD